MLTYTQMAESVFGHAKAVAKGLRHREVSAIHILLALAAEKSGLACLVLQKHGLYADKIMKTISSHLRFPVFSDDKQVPNDLPWSFAAQFVSTSAKTEASYLGHNYVGVEHILLAMTRLSSGQWFELASQSEMESIREEIFSLLGFHRRQTISQDEIAERLLAINREVEGLMKAIQGG